MAVHGPPSAGWYTDPHDPRGLRFWDGSAWTAHTHPGPTQIVASARGSGSRGSQASAVPWWQTWWIVVPALLLCFPLGLVGLWLRRDTAIAAKIIASIATVVLFVAVGVTGSGGEEEPTAAPGPATSAPSDAGSSDTPPSDIAEAEVEMAAVPPLEGLREARAVRALRAAGLEVGRITYKQSSTRPGTVLSQAVSTGTSVDLGKEIALVVAAPFPKVPSVVGKTAGAAEALLRGAGYVVERVYRTRTSGRSGEILGQFPRSGVRAREGSVITVTVLRVVAAPPQPSNCTPGYSPCLPPASDYDCAGGSGNGPEYAVGPVRVTGYDVYDLDADGDGTACDW